VSADTPIVGPFFFQRSPAEPRQRPLVLLIEDDAAGLDLYATLVDDDLSVLAATCGETGYALACSEEPDAVLIDARLPDMDGLSVCQRLRANPDTASIPVIMFTHPCSTDLLLATLNSSLARERTAASSR